MHLRMKTDMGQTCHMVNLNRSEYSMWWKWCDQLGVIGCVLYSCTVVRNVVNTGPGTTRSCSSLWTMVQPGMPYLAAWQLFGFIWLKPLSMDNLFDGACRDYDSSVLAGQVWITSKFTSMYSLVHASEIRLVQAVLASMWSWILINISMQICMCGWI